MATRIKVVLVCLFLAGAVFFLYAKVRTFGLIGRDDFVIIRYAESQVRPSFNIAGAFTGRPESFPTRAPVTILAHMLEVSIFGSNYGLYHFTNLILHASNTLFLFFVLRMLTGAFWRSACVAAIFGVHPLNVEVVAWIPGIAVLLEAFFFFLSIIFYMRYVKNHNPFNLLSVLLCFLLGLMAKPEILYLPFLLLFMDFWPLGRLHWERFVVRGGTKKSAIWPLSLRSPLAVLIKEKAPFFGIAIVYASVGLYFYLKKPVYGALDPNALFRSFIVDAPVVYTRFLLAVLLPIVPFRLLAFHGNLYALVVIFSLFFMVSFTVFAVGKAVTRPYLMLGWAWFVMAITIPVGICVFRNVVMADRYAYLPEIGLFIILVWAGHDLFRRFKYDKAVFIAAPVALFFSLMTLSWRNCDYFRNMETHVKRLISCGLVPPERAYSNVGDMLLRSGRPYKAIYYYEKSIAISQENAHFYNNLGVAYSKIGEASKAIAAFKKALEIDSGFALAHNNLANLLADLGLLDDAILHYKDALKTDPSNPELYNNLATALAQNGEIDEAVECLQKALAINPEYQRARDNLKRLLKFCPGGKLPALERR